MFIKRIIKLNRTCFIRCKTSLSLTHINGSSDTPPRNGYRGRASITRVGSCLNGHFL